MHIWAVDVQWFDYEDSYTSYFYEEKQAQDYANYMRIIDDESIVSGPHVIVPQEFTPPTYVWVEVVYLNGMKFAIINNPPTDYVEGEKHIEDGASSIFVKMTYTGNREEIINRALEYVKRYE